MWLRFTVLTARIKAQTRSRDENLDPTWRLVSSVQRWGKQPITEAQR